MPAPVRLLPSYPSFDRAGRFKLRSLSLRPDLSHHQLLFSVMQVFRRRTASALNAAIRQRSYSGAPATYAGTAEHLRINSDTKVIYQGFTGKQGRYVYWIPFWIP